MSFNRKAWGISVNGCGPNRWSWLIPDFVWKEPCNTHDVLYVLGAPLSLAAIMRARVDAKFLRDMNNNIQRYMPFLRPMLRRIAKGYYDAVRFKGKHYFKRFDSPLEWFEDVLLLAPDLEGVLTYLIEVDLVPWSASLASCEDKVLGFIQFLTHIEVKEGPEVERALHSVMLAFEMLKHPNRKYGL